MSRRPLRATHSEREIAAIVQVALNNATALLDDYVEANAILLTARTRRVVRDGVKLGAFYAAVALAGRNVPLEYAQARRAPIGAEIKKTLSHPETRIDRKGGEG